MDWTEETLEAAEQRQEHRDAIAQALRLVENVFADLGGRGDNLAVAVRALYAVQTEMEDR